MHGPTWIFWANLTPFSLQRKAQKLVYCAAGRPVDYSATSWNCWTPHGDVNKRGTPGCRPGLLTHGARGAARPLGLAIP
jgi:hypothetical protein